MSCKTTEAENVKVVICTTEHPEVHTISTKQALVMVGGATLILLIISLIIAKLIVKHLYNGDYSNPPN